MQYESEKHALDSRTGFVNIDGYIGHFGISAANYLVGTGKYQFEQSSWCGYILRRSGIANLRKLEETNDVD